LKKMLGIKLSEAQVISWKRSRWKPHTTRTAYFFRLNFVCGIIRLYSVIWYHKVTSLMQDLLTYFIASCPRTEPSFLARCVIMKTPRQFSDSCSSNKKTSATPSVALCEKQWTVGQRLWWLPRCLLLLSCSWSTTSRTTLPSPTR